MSAEMKLNYKVLNKTRLLIKLTKVKYIICNFAIPKRTNRLHIGTNR